MAVYTPSCDFVTLVSSVQFLLCIVKLHEEPLPSAASSDSIVTFRIRFSFITSPTKEGMNKPV